MCLLCKECVITSESEDLVFRGQYSHHAFWEKNKKQKPPDAGEDWRQEEKGMREDEMVGWHYRLNGDEFGWTPGVGDGQGAWCAVVLGVAKSCTRLSDWTELNWAEEINMILKGSYEYFVKVNILKNGM